MLRQKRWKVWAAVLAAVLILGFVYYLGINRDTEKAEPPTYSVILYQHTDNEWDTLIDGIRQAEKDKDVNVNYVTMAKEDTAKDQALLVQQEIDNGTAGILLAAVDSEELLREFSTMSISVPLYFLETGAGKDAVLFSADNYAMGCALGEQILRDMEEDGAGDGAAVTVLTEYMERDSVQERYQGLKDTLEQSDREIRIQEEARSAGDYSLRLFIGTLFNHSGLYIAALDKFSAEEAAAAWSVNRDVWTGAPVEFKIYGIGNTAQTVNDLDNGNLRCLVYQNEFNMGYQGLAAMAANRMDTWIKENTHIKFHTVTKATLYDSENERLLFPSA